YLILPQGMSGRGDALFALHVEGESMIDVGILSGDIIIVRRQQSADNGDIVVAMIDDEATVKRIFFEKNRVRLQPENRTMAPIYAQEVTVLGKVVSLFRWF
ncbi:MAG: S24 family peptidase, partial [Clostridia bacterium]